MAIKLTLMLCLQVVILQLNAQTGSTRISSIRAAYQRINSDSTLTSEVLNNEDFLPESYDGGTSLTGYYKGKQLVKIVRWLGSSHGTEQTEFYYKDRQLFFVFEIFRSFGFDEKSQEVLYDSLETTFEGRYYFFNRKLIDMKTTGHNRFEDDTLDPEKVLIAEGEELRQKLAVFRTSPR